MSDVAKVAYQERFEKVIHYVDANLYDDLSVELLGQVAGFSRYHFHRQFSAYMGLSVYKYIQLLRLKRASYQLVFKKQQQVIDIALDAGFESPESFSRAFKNAFGQTPSQFRKEPAWEPWHKKYEFPQRKGENIMDVEVVSFPDTQVAVLKHRAAPELVNESASKFIKWCKETGL